MSRTQPYNEDAERCVLGCTLLSGDAFDELAGIVQPWMFYKEAHRKIWEAVTTHYVKSEAVDVVTLAHTLKERGQFEDIGGASALQEIMASVPHALHAGYYGGIIRALAFRRKIIEQAAVITHNAYDETVEIDEVLERTEASIVGLVESRQGDETRSVDQLLIELADHIEHVREHGKNEGLPTGYSQLDTVTGGMHPGQLIVLAARPGMGKSALALCITRRMAKAGVPVLFHALEMSRLELSERLLSIETGVPLSNLRHAQSLTADEMQRIAESQSTLAGYALHVHDDPELNTMQIASSVRMNVRKRGIQCVIIDYLQLIEPVDKRPPREQQVAEMTRTLKRLAKSLNIVVIALSQLNRNVESQRDKRPKLSDLRESGAIEQDADQVWMLYRASEYPEFENLQHEEWEYIAQKYSVPADSGIENVAEVLIRKNRSGERGEVALRYNAPCTEFQDLATGPAVPQQHGDFYGDF